MSRFQIRAEHMRNGARQLLLVGPVRVLRGCDQVVLAAPSLMARAL